jgi:hypothetical protein
VRRRNKEIKKENEKMYRRLLTCRVVIYSRSFRSHCPNRINDPNENRKTKKHINNEEIEKREGKNKNLYRTSANEFDTVHDVYSFLVVFHHSVSSLRR